MKLINLNLLLLLALLVSCGESSVSSGKWTVSYDQVQKGHRIEKENQLLSDGVYASYKLGNKLVTTRDYKKSSSKVTAISDAFGQGSLLQVTYACTIFLHLSGERLSADGIYSSGRSR